MSGEVWKCFENLGTSLQERTWGSEKERSLSKKIKEALADVGKLHSVLEIFGNDHFRPCVKIT